MTQQRRTIWRRRAIAAVAAIIVVAAVISALVLALGGGGERPPATGAAALVPADALAYVNLSTDRTRPAVRRALALERRLPQLALLLSGVRSQIGAVVGGSAGAPVAADLSSWLGNEAALAVLDTPSATAGLLILADVARSARARQLLVSSGARQTSSYRGHELWHLASGNQAAFVSHFLAIGAEASVRTALDVAAGATPSLVGATDYQRASSGESNGRFIDLYASAAGVRRLLESRHDAAGALGIFLDQPALSAVSAAVSAQSPGLRVQVHSALDPRLANLRGSPRTFGPSLQDLVPGGSALMLDTAGLRRTVARLLVAATATGVGARTGPLLSRLGSALAAEGVNLGSVLSIFSGETAVVLGHLDGRSPSVAVLARTQDPAGARATLASLAIPLAQLFQPSGASSGVSPVISDHQIGGVTVHQISLTAGLDLYYTVDDGQVIISTSLGAMQALIARHRSLSSDAAYQATVSGGSSRVTSLLFLDFSQLLNLGEQTGLARGARYAALRAELQGIRTAGLVSTGGETDSNAELLLQIP